MRISRGLAVVTSVAGILVVGVSTLVARELIGQSPKPRSGHQTMAKGSGGSDAAKIAKAMSAAPPDISKNAAIMEVGEGGKMKQLRAARTDGCA